MMKYVFVSDGKLYCKSIDNRKISVKDGKIICDFSKDPEDWITMNGAHVELGEGGQVVGGACGKFNGSIYKGTQKTKHTQQKSGTISSRGGGGMKSTEQKRDAILKMGGNRWQAGNHDRTYLGGAKEFTGYDPDKKTYNGEKISNSYSNDIYQALRNVWVDNKTMKVERQYSPFNKRVNNISERLQKEFQEKIDNM